MDYLAMQNEVGSQTRFDVAVAANLTLVKRWINRAQQYVAAKHDWSWLQAREIVQTVIDKTAGTVAITAGGTTVTGTSTAFAAVDVGAYIQFSSSNDWYRIATRTSTTSLTIEAAYVGTSDLTAGTYTIRRFYYSLSTSVDRVVKVKQAVSRVALTGMSPITLDRWAPLSTTTGKPTAYACWALSAAEAGVWVMQFYPWPDVAMNMEVDYYRIPANLSADTDVGLIPVKIRDTALVDGAIAYGYQYLNDPRYQAMWEKFEGQLERFWLQDGQNRGEFSVLEPVDSTTQDPDLIRYPAGYPSVGPGY